MKCEGRINTKNSRGLLLFAVGYKSTSLKKEVTNHDKITTKYISLVGISGLILASD